MSMRSSLIQPSIMRMMAGGYGDFLGGMGGYGRYGGMGMGGGAGGFSLGFGTWVPNLTQNQPSVHEAMMLALAAARNEGGSYRPVTVQTPRQQTGGPKADENWQRFLATQSLRNAAQGQQMRIREEDMNARGQQAQMRDAAELFKDPAKLGQLRALAGPEAFGRIMDSFGMAGLSLRPDAMPVPQPTGDPATDAQLRSEYAYRQANPWAGGWSGDAFQRGIANYRNTDPTMVGQREAAKQGPIGAREIAVGQAEWDQKRDYLADPQNPTNMANKAAMADYLETNKARRALDAQMAAQYLARLKGGIGIIQNTQRAKTNPLSPGEEADNQAGNDAMAGLGLGGQSANAAALAKALGIQLPVGPPQLPPLAKPPQAQVPQFPGGQRWVKPGDAQLADDTVDERYYQSM